MIAAPIVFRFNGPFLLPVGSHLDVRTYLVHPRDVHPLGTPLLRHVETGVLLGSEEHFEPGTNGLLRSTMRLHREWRGKIEACWITGFGSSHAALVTSLRVVPVELPEPYR